MVPTGLPRIDGVELVLIAAESVLYGAFIVLFINGVRVLLGRRKRSGAKNVGIPLITALVLFALTSAHWALDLSRAYDAFILAQDRAAVEGTPAGFPNPATAFLANIGTRKYVIISALYFIATMIGDAFMLYRLFVVWNRDIRIVIVPSILELALCGVGINNLNAISATNGSLFLIAKGWITAFFVLTLVANLSCTLLIAFRIWYTNRKFIGSGVAGTGKIVQILVESASLYSSFLIMTLIGYLAQSNVQFVFTSMNSPIIGIIFMMIIVRTGELSSQNPPIHMISTTDAEWNLSAPTPRQHAQCYLGPRPYSLQNIALKVAPQAESDRVVGNPHHDGSVMFMDPVKVSDI